MLKSNRWQIKADTLCLDNFPWRIHYPDNCMGCLEALSVLAKANLPHQCFSFFLFEILIQGFQGF